MKTTMMILGVSLLALALGAQQVDARGGGGSRGGARIFYGGGTHTNSHGGTYIGGAGPSHKGGTYVNPASGNRYGIHQGSPASVAPLAPLNILPAGH